MKQRYSNTIQEEFNVTKDMVSKLVKRPVFYGHYKDVVAIVDEANDGILLTLRIEGASSRDELKEGIKGYLQMLEINGISAVESKAGSEQISYNKTFFLRIDKKGEFVENDDVYDDVDSMFEMIENDRYSDDYESVDDDYTFVDHIRDFIEDDRAFRKIKFKVVELGHEDRDVKVYSDSDSLMKIQKGLKSFLRKSEMSIGKDQAGTFLFIHDEAEYDD